MSRAFEYKQKYSIYILEVTTRENLSICLSIGDVVCFNHLITEHNFLADNIIHDHIQATHNPKQTKETHRRSS